MRGNKRTFPNFHICFLISMNSNYFQRKTLERRWHDFFHLFKWQGVLKIFEFHLRIFSNSETLCNSMIFTRGDKMTSSNYMKYELGVSKDQIPSLLELFFNLELFEFYSNYFSPKIKYMEIRVTWFPIIENWRKLIWNHFGILKMIFIGFY